MPHKYSEHDLWWGSPSAVEKAYICICSLPNPFKFMAFTLHLWSWMPWNKRQILHTKKMHSLRMIMVFVIKSSFVFHSFNSIWTKPSQLNHWRFMLDKAAVASINFVSLRSIKYANKCISSLLLTVCVCPFLIDLESNKCRLFQFAKTKKGNIAVINRALYHIMWIHWHVFAMYE